MFQAHMWTNFDYCDNKSEQSLVLNNIGSEYLHYINWVRMDDFQNFIYNTYMVSASNLYPC